MNTGRKPTHQNLNQLISYCILKYYRERDKDKTIKLNPEKHLKLANQTIKYYHNELQNTYPQWDDDEARGAVRKQIDFLTGVFTKEEKAKADKDKLKAFKEQVQQQQVRSRNIIW